MRAVGGGFPSTSLSASSTRANLRRAWEGAPYSFGERASPDVRFPAMEQSPDSAAVVPPQQTTPQVRDEAALTWRVAVLAVGLVIVGAFWVQYAEVIAQSCLVGEAVPSIPALLTLVALCLLVPVLGRVRRWLALGRAEVLMIYGVLVISVPLASYGGLQIFMTRIGAMEYYKTAGNHFARYQAQLPSWLFPDDHGTIKQLYEGSEKGKPGGLASAWRDAGLVPWRAWRRPLAVWSAFLVVLFLTQMCLASLFYRRWSREERLAFPLVELAMRVSQPTAFFRSPLMWIGFSLSGAYNLVNFLHIFYPAVPSMGYHKYLVSAGAPFPLGALYPFYLNWNPAFVGLGYLVSNQVLLSTWVFELVLKAEAVLIVLLGYAGEASTFWRGGPPFPAEQAAGAFLGICALLLWGLRHHLRRGVRELAPAFRAAASRRPPNSSDAAEGPIPSWIALPGFVAGLAAMVAFWTLAGMSSWVAFVLLGLLLLWALGYTRIRADTGTPVIWLYPYPQQTQLITNALGTSFVEQHGGFQNLTFLALFQSLAVGYIPMGMAWQMENFRMAERARIRMSTMTLLMIVACVAGLAASWYALLTAYYKYGMLSVRHMGGGGDYDFAHLAGWEALPEGPRHLRLEATGVGLGTVGVLAALRGSFLSFPLHPLGFAIATTHGDAIWFPFFCAWAFKAAVLRYGGNRSYQQFIPLFLGLMLGHFVMGGLLWGIIAGAIGANPGYIVYFG